MSDPLSMTASIIAVTQIVSQIYTLVKDVTGAKSEIRVLCEELFALQGILEHVRMQITTSSSNEPIDNDGPPHIVRSKEFECILTSTRKLVEDLLQRLQGQKGGIQSKMQSVSWPFKKDEFKEQITRLERVKSWFMMAMLNDNSNYTERTYEELRSLTKAMDLDRDKRDNNEREKLADDIAKWLAPVDQSTIHSRAYNAHQPGTGTWFLEGQFQTWVNGRPTVLSLTGPSGSGKSVMVSAAVERLKELLTKDSNIGLAYFYCAFNDAASQKLIIVLGSLLASLSAQRPDLLLNFEEEYQQSKQGGGLERSKLRMTEEKLKECCRSFPRVYILVDALNETDETAEIVNSLATLFQSTNNVSILLTNINDTKTEPLKQPLEVVRVYMDKYCITRDVTTFVETTLSNTSTFLCLDDSLKAEIRKVLISQSQGSFRWTQCQIDWLSSRRTRNAVRQALEQLPATLEATYTDMLKRISEFDRDWAREALLWLSYAERPLSLAELCEAVVLEDGSLRFDQDDRMLESSLILDICRGLVAYDQIEDTVTLAHFSVKEYLATSQMLLKSDPFYHLEYKSSQIRLASKCLTYLNLPSFSGGAFHSGILKSFFNDWPLYSYVTEYWGEHVWELGDDIPNRVQDQINKFFDTQKLKRGGNYGTWITARYPENYGEDLVSAHPLYYACAFGLTPVVRLLLDTDPTLDINMTGGRTASPIVQTAAYYGNYDTTKLLLERGADPNKENRIGETALWWVVRTKQRDIRDLLLRFGARFNHPKEYESGSKGSHP